MLIRDSHFRFAAARRFMFLRFMLKPLPLGPSAPTPVSRRSNCFETPNRAATAVYATPSSIATIARRISSGVSPLRPFIIFGRPFLVIACHSVSLGLDNHFADLFHAVRQSETCDFSFQNRANEHVESFDCRRALIR